MNDLHAGPPESARSSAPPSEVERYRELDGLRALAVIAGFLFHIVPAAPALFARGPDVSFEWFGSTIVPPTRVFDYVFHLNVGVQVFFVLSGFLITSMYIRPWFSGQATPAALPYAFRRAARIFPAYWLVLFVGGVTWFGLGEIDFASRSAMIRHATLTYLYFPERWVAEFGGVDYGGLSVSWSLVAEVTFYAFVPLWMAALRWRAGSSRRATDPLAFRRAMTMAAGCIPIGVACVFVFTYHTPWATEVPLGGLITVFGAGLVSLGAGMVLAVVVAGSRPAVHRRLGELGTRTGWWWGGAGLLFIVLAWPDFPYLQASSAQQTWQRLMQPIIATLLVTPLVLAPGARTVVHRTLRHRGLVWIGTISYGIYLWHTVVIGKLVEDHPIFDRGFWGASAIVVAAAAVTLVLAAASWYLVERPLLAWSRSRFGRSKGRGPSPTLAPS